MSYYIAKYKGRSGPIEFIVHTDGVFKRTNYFPYLDPRDNSYNQSGGFTSEWYDFIQIIDKDEIKHYDFCFTHKVFHPYLNDNLPSLIKKILHEIL